MLKKILSRVFNRFFFLFNIVAASLLLLSYASTYLPPKSFQYVSILAMLLPAFAALNVLCVVIWVVKFKIRFLISAAALLVVSPFAGKFYGTGSQEEPQPSDIKVMSYNVRLFNEYKNTDLQSVDESIVKLIKQEDPDILCIQEYYETSKVNIGYPYKYIASNKKVANVGQAIFSKYEILNKGDISFLNKTKNHTTFVDVAKGKDTLRIYNVHLQSLSIDPISQNINKEEVDFTLSKIEKTFKFQSEQVKLIKNHQKESPYKTIICGDFNNTASSWMYRKLSEGKKDAFEEAGSGFGATYDFPIIPVRIDFILVDKSIKVKNFNTYKVNYSDHFPILSFLEL